MLVNTYTLTFLSLKQKKVRLSSNITLRNQIFYQLVLVLQRYQLVVIAPMPASVWTRMQSVHKTSVNALIKPMQMTKTVLQVRPLNSLENLPNCHVKIEIVYRCHLLPCTLFSFVKHFLLKILIWENTVFSQLCHGTGWECRTSDTMVASSNPIGCEIVAPSSLSSTLSIPVWNPRNSLIFH